MTFQPSPLRYKVAHYPDLMGLSRIARSVWRTWSSRRPNSAVTRDFSESIFMDQIMQLGFKLACIAALRNEALPDFYKQEWFISQLRALNQRRLPKFLLSWAEGLGSFVGPDGSRMVTSIPEPDFTDGNGDMDARYCSSFPNFNLLRQVVLNEREVLAWDSFREDGTPVTPANPATIPPASVAINPGSEAAPIGMTRYVRENLANMVIRRVDPGAGNRDLEFFLQRDDAYEAYAHQAIRRLVEGDRDLLPSGVYTYEELPLAGNGAAAYMVRPSPSLTNRDPMSSIVVTFAGDEPQIVPATYARLFQYSVLKRPNAPAPNPRTNVRDPAELVARYDPSLLPDVQRSPAFPVNEMLEAYATTIFGIATSD